MPAATRLLRCNRAAFCLLAVVCAACPTSTTCADEPLEPQPLRIPTDARVLSPSTYRETSPSSMNDTAGDHQPASFEPRTPQDQGLVPWPKVPRADAANPEPPALNAAEVKLPVKPRQGGTLALRRAGTDEKPLPPRGASSGLGTMFISLFFVLGLFFLATWMLKRGMPKGASLLPSEVVELMGRAPLGSKQHVHLLRVGNKMLLVALSAAGAETLTEITDPVEVDRLAGLCQQQNPHSSTNAFKHIFQQFGRRGEPDQPDDELSTARGGLGTREVQHG